MLHFSCDVSSIKEAVNNVSLAVAPKSNIPALEGVLLECTPTSLMLTGYDLDMGIMKKIPVKTETPGNIVLGARLFGDILRKLPAGTVEIEVDDKFVTTIKAGDAEFNIMGISAEEYPDMPEVKDMHSFSLPEYLLKNMISQTLFAVSVTDQTPVHTGSLFDVRDGVLCVVSVDGYRLALRREKVDAAEDFKFVVPGKTLNEIGKLLTDSEENMVRLTVSRKHIIFDVNGYYVVSRLLEGEFLDYRSSIPAETTTTLRVETRTFIGSIDRASIIIDDRAKSPVRCTVSGHDVSLACESGMGKVSDRFDANVEGAEVTIGFNNKYMTDALKNAGSDEVLLQINGPLSPMKVVPVEGDSFLFLVLPVRLKTS